MTHPQIFCVGYDMNEGKPSAPKENDIDESQSRILHPYYKNEHSNQSSPQVLKTEDIL